MAATGGSTIRIIGEPCLTPIAMQHNGSVVPRAVQTDKYSVSTAEPGSSAPIREPPMPETWIAAVSTAARSRQPVISEPTVPSPELAT
jgi:hypothetical protein